MAAYYNEFDPKAAAWLRELIKQGHIADGVVDDRSIEDVTPTELTGFTQCHFFAGIGVWSYALRRAGWADDRPVWTGSCPCQPFSAAGKGSGFDDERHLWPAFHHLISQCRPPIVLGEQVASKDGLGWLDLVQADLEATGYASGAVDLCAAGIGAPHIRQRLWWVGTRLADTKLNSDRSKVATPNHGWDKEADRPASGIGGCGSSCGSVANSDNAGSQGRVSGRSDQGWEDQLGHGGRGSAIGGMADTASGGQLGAINARERGTGMVQAQSSRGSGGGGLADPSGIGRKRGQGSEDGREHDGQDAGWQQGDDGAVRDNETGDVGLADPRRELQAPDWGQSSEGGQQLGTQIRDNRRSRFGGLADTKRTGFRDCGCGVNEEEARGEQGEERQRERIWSVSGANGSDGGSTRPGPTNGHWRDADWLFCRDGKWRPVEPGTSPLAHGAAQRVGRLRGYGNAIVAQAAQAFIESVMD